MSGRWVLKLAAVLLAGTGCAAEDGTMMTISGVLVPSSGCVVSPSSETRFSGAFDPLGDRFLLAPLITSRLVGAQNDVVIQGFDVCWALSGQAGQFDTVTVPLLDCDALSPAQKSFEVSTGSVPAGDSAVSTVGVLRPTNVKALFGAAFDPEAIPAAESAEDDPRDPAWGSFPKTETATVVVQLRAVGGTQDGTLVHSNWFSYPVDICANCAKRACAPVGSPAACGCGPFQDEDMISCDPACP